MLAIFPSNWRPALGALLIALAVGPATRAQTPEEIFNAGIGNVVTSDDAGLGFVPAPTAVGTTYDLTVTFAETGQHGINCFDLSGGGIDETEADHVTMFTVGE